MQSARPANLERQNLPGYSHPEQALGGLTQPCQVLPRCARKCLLAVRWCGSTLRPILVVLVSLRLLSPMFIFVKTLYGQTITLLVDSLDTIEDVKFTVEASNL